MNKVLTTILFLGMVVSISATDHVMQATKAVDSRETKVDSQLSLSLKEAQDYAVQQNRTLRNASLAVQEAYASRWQTIASMLPQVDASYGYSDMFDFQLDFGGIPMAMANTGTLNITASVGLNGQAVVGVLLNNIAIDMKKIAFEQNEIELRGNVISAYVTVLALQGLSALLDSSLVNIEDLYAMTQRSVEVGAAEQTTADLIKVRVNAMKNSIETQQNGISLASNALKVLLNVPVETEITLTDELKDLLSAEHILNLLGDEFNIANNLNYQLLEKNTELAKRNVAMAGWAYGPTVSLAYQYSDVHKFGDGFGGMSMPHVMNVSIKMPLWSSGKRAAGVVEKKIAYEEAKNTLSETTANLGIQHQQLCNNLTTTYRTYLNQVENLEVSGRVFNNMANKFRYGVASNMELVNASNDLITAQSGYVNAVLDLVNAQVELEKFLNN